MRFLKYILPHLIETVTWLKGTFKFDGVTIQFDGFERAADYDDASVFQLMEEKVMYIPDLMNGDQPPF